MAPDLSEDLVEEILARVPATSLKQLRSTCKLWNALFKDERFAKTHFAKARKQFMLLMLKENRVYSMSVNLHGIASPSVELCLTDSHKNTSKHVCISRVFHCDGLLLCTTSEDMIVVWNPCLGETRWIQPKAVHKEVTWFALGYQNTTSSCRSYKILKCRCHCNPNGQLVRVFEIFELSSDSWRVLDVVIPPCMFHFLSGVSLKGNTYWPLDYKKDGSYDRVLLGFDFSTETFRSLCLPVRGFSMDTVALSVVREEKLLLLHQSFKTLKLDIWVTTSIDQIKALSWSKFLAVDLYTHNCRLAYDVTFFMEEEKRVAMCIGKRNDEKIVCIIGEDGKYREFSIEESTSKSMMRQFVFNYVPSLVHIQKG